MSKNILYIIIIAIILLAIMGISHFKNSSILGRGEFFSGDITLASTTVATTTPTKLLSKNANRQYAFICNTHASSGIAMIYFVQSGTSSLNAFARDRLLGFPLESMPSSDQLTAGRDMGNVCYEITQNNLYQGEVWAQFFSSTTGVILTGEK